MKQWIELTSIAINIVVTGQEDDKDGGRRRDAEEKTERIDLLSSF